MLNGRPETIQGITNGDCCDLSKQHKSSCLSRREWGIIYIFPPGPVSFHKMTKKSEAIDLAFLGSFDAHHANHLF